MFKSAQPPALPDGAVSVEQAVSSYCLSRPTGQSRLVLRACFETTSSFLFSGVRGSCRAGYSLTDLTCRCNGGSAGASPSRKRHVVKKVLDFLNCDDGVASVEYAVFLMFIIAALLTGVQFAGGMTAESLQNSSGRIGNVIGPLNEGHIGDESYW